MFTLCMFARLRRLIASRALLAAAVPLVTGCVSVTSLSYDEELSSASNLPEACTYQWPKDIRVYGRARVLIGTSNWFDANQYGAGLARVVNREIAERCSASVAPKAEGEAKVVVSYVNDMNRAFRGAGAVVFLATLGIAPIPASDSFTLCVAIELPDGRHRYAISEGSISRVENIFGTRPAERRTNQAEMLENLLLRAFRKAWGPGDVALEHGNCDNELDSRFPPS